LTQDLNDPALQDMFIKLGLRNESYSGRVLAHQSLFKHRHPNETPKFHEEIINLWHSRIPSALVMVFREGGKSTIAEEAFVIGAGYQLFHNALIIGSTEKRACERLRAIKHEVETNDNVQLLFGDLRGHTWNEAEVILGNGVRIIAVGRGQSLRGTKHLHYRPDFCFCDDIEEDENVRTPEARDETLSWFMSTVVPALDVSARIRVNATPLDKEALPFTLKDKLKWPTRVFPIEYIDEKGERQATWPARYPLPWIDQKRREFEAAGKIQDFMREYMCVAEDPARKIFTADMFKIKPTVRTWQPTWAFFDPARTTKATSATTGWAVWSWTSNRLIVWDGGGDLWKPDEIVSHVFAVDDEYRPIAIGVEEDGLNEFLMQPLRHAMVQRGYLVPVVPWRAPKGKLSFIESLQPFFRSGEITFAKELPELQAQFLNFPSGRIDGPNALAYALLMRPGQVVYDDFGGGHVVDRSVVNPRRPCSLCLHARDGVVTGVLVQFHNGTLAIVADWVIEGDPGAAVAQIVKEASLETPTLRLVAPAVHFGAYNHLGLVGAVARIPAEVRAGSACEVGRDELRALLQRRVRDRPAVAVAMTARWTLNAFAAGYAYEVGKDGRLTSEPRTGIYRCLMEGLESFTGMLGAGILEDRGKPNVQRTASGQLYISALPGKSEIVDAKDSFPSSGVVSDRGAFSARRS
jgi:hypothetical protein